jgi:hypothetical protein
MINVRRSPSFVQAMTRWSRHFMPRARWSNSEREKAPAEQLDAFLEDGQREFRADSRRRRSSSLPPAVETLRGSAFRQDCVG